MIIMHNSSDHSHKSIHFSSVVLRYTHDNHNSSTEHVGVSLTWTLQSQATREEAELLQNIEFL